MTTRFTVIQIAFLVTILVIALGLFAAISYGIAGWAGVAAASGMFLMVTLATLLPLASFWKEQ